MRFADAVLISFLTAGLPQIISSFQNFSPLRWAAARPSFFLIEIGRKPT